MVSNLPYSLKLNVFLIKDSDNYHIYRELRSFHLDASLLYFILSTPDQNQPFGTDLRLGFINGTQEPKEVPFFIIQGLSNLDDRKMILFVILLLAYIVILGGNSMIIFVVQMKTNSFTITRIMVSV